MQTLHAVSGNYYGIDYLHIAQDHFDKIKCAL